MKMTKALGVLSITIGLLGLLLMIPFFNVSIGFFSLFLVVLGFSFVKSASGIKKARSQNATTNNIEVAPGIESSSKIVVESTPAYLITSLFGTKKGALSVDNGMLSFVQADGTVVLNENLSNIIITNKLFPMMYLSLKTPAKELRLIFNKSATSGAIAEEVSLRLKGLQVSARAQNPTN